MRVENASWKLLFERGLRGFERGLRGLDGFEVVHHYETAGDLAFRLFCFSCFFAVGNRRVSDASVEQTAERSATLKTDFEANIRDAHVVVSPQQLFRFFDATFDQVLMRGFVKGLPEKTREVIAREAGLFGIWSRLSG